VSDPKPQLMVVGTRALALLAALAAVGSTAGPASSSPSSPRITYASLWADAGGRTHIASCAVNGMKLVSYAPPAAPEWIGVSREDVKGIVYEVSPVGYVGTWHRAPGPQWVFTLSGRWEVETTDGHHLIQGPGQFQYNGDSTSHPDAPHGSVGHTARTIGDVPNVRMIVQLKRRPVNERCPL
jgi:hypothetical protein